MNGTVLTIHTKEDDPDRAYFALLKAIDLINDLRAIEGLRVVVSGDLEVMVERALVPDLDPEDEALRNVIRDGYPA